MATKVQYRNTLHHPIVKLVDGSLLSDIINVTVFEDLLDDVFFLEIVNLFVYLLAF